MARNELWKNLSENFNDKKYDKSLEILEQLIEINPRYKNAAPLLEAVKEKLDK